MKTSNVELMEMAEKSLTGKWGLAVGTYFVYFLILIALQLMNEYVPLSGIATLIITGPLTLGLAIFSLNISRNTNPKSDQLFDGFKNFGTSIGAYLLMVIFISLWTLLLIIPGIIAALSYAMTFYIIADDDSIGAMDAIDKSKEMMEGFKWKLFCLNLRFLGWGLLCLLTLGIGFLWLAPYIQVSLANFYLDVKEQQNSIHKDW